MKISTFIPITNPFKRGDTFLEAIKSHLLFSDELIIVDGGSTDGSLEMITALNDPKIRIITLPWPQENWSWDEFPKHWNAGLEACTGDWVAAGETDHIFHEADIERLIEELSLNQKLGRAVMTVNKMQTGKWNRMYSKSKMYYFINKKDYPNVKYGFDPREKTDLCQPIEVTGEKYGIPMGTALVEHNANVNAKTGASGVPMYNYLWTFKTYEMVVKERLAAANAWNLFKGFTEEYNIRFRSSEEEVRQWITEQLAGVDYKANQEFNIERHPAIMQEKLKRDLKEGMIGWNPNQRPE